MSTTGWSIQLPTGEFLESVPDLAFELNNQVFSTDDATVVPGSFSFPADLPLTRQNKVLLYNPHLVTNSRNFRKWEGCWVYADGVPLFLGTLTITQADDRKARIKIVSNPMESLRNIEMRELDLGGDRTIADMLAHAKATTLDPLDYDYVFAPVYNPAYVDAGSLDDRAVFQNFWNLSTDVFEVGHAYPALTPFPRIEYLLERIFSGISFEFTNRFQTNDEMRRLLAYSSTSLWASSGLPGSINLTRHVSKTKSNEWLKKIMIVFNLGLFTNIFSRKISLVPLSDLLQRPAARDWTQYAIDEPVIDTLDNFPPYIAFKPEEDDAVFERFPPAPLPPLNFKGTVEKLEDLDTGGPYDPGIYYVTARHSYYYAASPGASPYVFAYTELGRAPVRSGEVLELPMPPLFDHQPSIISGTADVWGACIPWIEQPGTVSYLEDSEPIEQEYDIPDRLLWYRGHQINPYGGNYPLCSSLPYDGLDELIDTQSLRIDGERGLYQVRWGVWHNMLRNGKPALQRFAIPISELVEFSFEEKVRTSSMDYFIKRLRIQKLLGHGYVLVEANMISTI